MSTRFFVAAVKSVETEQLLPSSKPEPVLEDAPKALKGYTEFEPEVEQLLDVPGAARPGE